MGGARIFSIGGDKPKWRRVPSAEVMLPPYNAVGAVRVFRGDKLIDVLGTAWLGHERRAFSAGHVIESALRYVPALNKGADGARIRIAFGLRPSGEAVINAEPVKLAKHPDGGNANAFDVGFFEFSQPITLAPLKVGSLSSGAWNEVQIPGFPKGTIAEVSYFGDQMYADKSAATFGNGLVKYQADTYDFHSGAPVIFKNTTGWESIGIHVGGYGINWGVALNDSIMEFLQS